MFVAVIMVIILGVISFTQMPTDLLPSIDLPYLAVITTYPCLLYTSLLLFTMKSLLSAKISVLVFPAAPSLYLNPIRNAR